MMVFGKGILAEPYCQNVVQYMLQYRTSFKVNVQKGCDIQIKVSKILNPFLNYNRKLRVHVLKII